MLKKPPVYRNRIELLQGTLDLLILQTLQWGPRHGYGISQAIRAGSGDVLRADTGSLSRLFNFPLASQSGVRSK
jgi:PadR family transcriptional regulator PadR